MLKVSSFSMDTIKIDLKQCKQFRRVAAGDIVRASLVV